MDVAGKFWRLFLEGAAFSIEVAATLILIAGATRFVVLVAPHLSPVHSSSHLAFQQARMTLGAYILAALEFLIVADIIFTVLHRTLEQLYILAILTAIRTALSWFLTREMQALEKGSDETG